MAKKYDPNKVYQIITDRIVDQLKKGVIPWRRPWAMGAPVQNLVYRKPYRGCNPIFLNCLGYDHPWYLTFKQAAKLTGNANPVKGEHGYPVVWWSRYEDKKKPKNPKTGKYPMRMSLIYHTVFNVAQVAGLVAGEHYPLPEIPDGKPFEPIDAAEKIVAGYPDPAPNIETRGNQACYHPMTDDVYMPSKDKFTNPAGYYATLFHELGHSTGHSSRLDRDMTGGRKSKAYATEELVAEMTAAFLCGQSGIDPALGNGSGNEAFSNAAAYVANWLQALGDDPRLVVTAGGKAQKAADHILGVKWDKKNKNATDSKATVTA
jgi:antirestriction protein ArdC